MKVQFMPKEKKDLIILAKMSIIKEHQMKNGTHMIEDQAPAEAEILLKVVMVKETGATLLMKLSSENHLVKVKNNQSLL